MTSFTFEPQAQPFPRWMGPFSPARGTYSGFRFHDRKLGTWVEEGSNKAFWPFADSTASSMLTNLVIKKWGGGRVLLLPSGFIIKPLQRDGEVGQRVLIGHFRGSILLKKPLGGTFSLSKPDNLQLGDRWPGPKTTGLECAIDESGTLKCTWYHPTTFGRDEITKQLRGPDRLLAAGFRRSRPYDSGGRVRITANGHIITNRQESDGTWVAHYVGRIDPAGWKADWEQFIRRGKP